MALLESAAPASAPPRLPALLAKAWRYGLTTSGTIATSAAHFLASLIFVRNLATGDFGLLSFALVLVPFAMSAIGSTAVIPVTCSLAEPEESRARTAAICIKLNLLLTLAITLIVFAALVVAHAAPLPALVLGLFGGFAGLRWFARCFAYVQGDLGRAVASDWAYALVLALSLGALMLAGRITLLSGAASFLAAGLAGMLPLGTAFFRAQWAAWKEGRLRDYAPIFRDLTRWSLLGVFFTEVTVNAHAYLVTFFSGSGAFALLALGMLMMRPISLVQGALPDLERPAMARAIAAKDYADLARTEGDFRLALLAVWVGSLALALLLLLVWPELLLRKGYALDDAVTVTLISAAIMMIRNFRTPPAVKLQAAGEFKALAGIGTKSCAVSVLGTLIMLAAFGPVASLLGIAAGESVILFEVVRLARQWQARHG
jgi:hypothetical protein